MSETNKKMAQVISECMADELSNMVYGPSFLPVIKLTPEQRAEAKAQAQREREEFEHRARVIRGLLTLSHVRGALNDVELRMPTGELCVVRDGKFLEVEEEEEW